MHALRAILASLLAATAIEALLTLQITAAPVGSAFTYQGILSNGGQPTDGVYDLRFGLYANSTGGGLVAGAITNENVRVSGGLLVTRVDFGLNVYDGTEYWLDLAVRNGPNTGQFTPLAPRQLLTPTPYAIHAKLAGSVPPGSIGAAAIQDNAVVRSINGLQDDFTILGDGLLVDTVGDSIIVRLPPPDCLTYSNCYWNLRGNGNIIAGTHFLGTVAGELAPLELRVNNNRSLLHTYTSANTSPNTTGGYKGNAVSGTGGTISGGGQLTGINQVLADYGTVAGGYSNVIQTPSTGGAIGGGASNRIAGAYGTAGGGSFNVVSNYSVVDGGSRNRALSAYVAIGGGEANMINPLTSGMVTIDSRYCTIGGGVSNTIDGAEGGTIGGGRNNNFAGSSLLMVLHGTISGGQGNSIRSKTATSQFSTIGGGLSNVIRTAGGGAIGGGRANMLMLEGHNGTIGGGWGNTVNGPYSTISGGHSNLISGGGNPEHCAIGGGGDNSILFDSHYSFLGGGRSNRIEGGATHSTIVGGWTNLIAMLSGGFAAIGGGSNNFINGAYGTIPGGLRNTATNMTMAAGRRAKAIHTGAFVWADSNDFDFPSTNINSFNVRATGGTRIVSGIDGAGVPNAGVRLDPGSTSWATISDRDTKKNFEPVDAKAVLEKLAAVPVQKWNYTWEDDTHPLHLGPMAQDFKQAFYPGESDKVITTLEFDGVALAAIQGLNQKLEDQLKAKNSEIEGLRQQNQALAQRQERLEKQLQDFLAR